MNVFGMEFKSREEREREEQEYLYRIFPGGKYWQQLLLV